MEFTQFGTEIFERKYSGDYKGRPNHYYKNLAKLVSLGDAGLEQQFADLLLSGRFSPGGRILAYGGRTRAAVSLMNCTTHAVDGDDLDAISETIWTIMKASSHGQGIGIDLSKLRPRGAAVNNASKTSTGAISFMEMLNTVGGTIGQEGRRAALLFSLRVDHPDLWRKDAQDIDCPKCNGTGCANCGGTGKVGYDFLHVKSLPGHVESANISVIITDEFMRAVQNDVMWALHFKGDSGGEGFHVASLVPARDLFNEICRNAHENAEPGILFEDTARQLSNSDLVGFPLTGVNACSEQWLDQDGVCNLGSINLAAYVRYPYSPDATFDTATFIKDVGVAVEFLDNVLDLELAGEHSISKRQAKSVRHLRRVGLGVMGLADTLVKLGLHYRYETGTIGFLHELFRTMRDAAYEKSILLATTKGACGAWDVMGTDQRSEVVEGGFYATLDDAMKAQIVEHGIRNITLLSVAPTGSIANMLGISTGIEPLFAREYVRRVRLSGEDKFITIVHPAVEESRAAGLPDEVWDTAYEVEPLDHVYIQAIIQAYVDSAIAKTTNLPANATVEDVAAVYQAAWENGLKGITVYRDASRAVQVLYSKETAPKADNLCPQCGTEMIKADGCETCPSCGSGKCSI